ncbi:diphosphomevalonate decarboxylase [Enterococcus sp. 8G7_MSG3316]|uniref:diphosphomevalonate decarboxylase n=1 Tax=Candidatus Enterococcus testudinis TaxID=1834191 RepID=A0A242A9L8_9ENTE|nr:diphosphomevalonate decarboxylase [Enterococcus sp. 8G7_MSG3316]OTN77619.1 diphosphomevalonate decarboxylase [Enterococcus sp. 8G7_MSG3316]
MYKGKARAYTNIALIKYWGKKDEALILPMNNSLSLTLDAFYTETTVTFDKTFAEDQFFLDDQQQSASATKKISAFLDLIRAEANCPFAALVESHNFVPTAAGLASSASGLAALAGACNEALGMALSPEALSRLARKGSGSACRSIYGGFAEWQQGTDTTSYAIQVPSNQWENDLSMIFILINDQAKEVSSRDGMRRTVETSSFYDGWLTSAAADLQTIKQAIAEQDFTALGEVAEANALKMHATTLAAQPPFTYWSPESLRAMDCVRQIRQQGLPCYFTMDAGPNVKVLCQKQDEQAILHALQSNFAQDQLVLAHAGSGLTALPVNDHATTIIKE